MTAMTKPLSEVSDADLPDTTGFNVIALILAYGSTYQVSEGHSAVVTRFGEPVRVVKQPGLRWKWPWPIETSHIIDMRNRFFNTPFTATFTRDRRNIVLLSYVVWSVEDPLLFFQSLGTLESAEQKLDGMVTAGKNYHFGRYDLTAIVSTNEQDIQLDKIEQAILDDVRSRPRRNLASASSRWGSSGSRIRKRTSRQSWPRCVRNAMPKHRNCGPAAPRRPTNSR